MCEPAVGHVVLASLGSLQACIPKAPTFLPCAFAAYSVMDIARQIEIDCSRSYAVSRVRGTVCDINPKERVEFPVLERINECNWQNEAARDFNWVRGRK